MKLFYNKKLVVSILIAILALVFALIYSKDYKLGTSDYNPWNLRLGSYLETASPNGYNVLINGLNKYLNFGTLSGENGYGIRDNSGIIEYKNSGDVWSGIGSSVSSDTNINGVVGPNFLFSTSSSGNLTINISTTTGTITFNPGVTTGYLIPLLASTTNWNTAYSWGNHAGLYDVYGQATSSINYHFNNWTTHNSYPTACTAGQYVSAIGDTLTCSSPTGGSQTPWIASIDGASYNLYSVASIGIGTTSNAFPLNVQGNSRIYGELTITSSTTIQNLTAANCDVKADAFGGLYCGLDATGGGGLTGSTGQIAYFSGTNTAVGTSTVSINTDGRAMFEQSPYIGTSSREITDNQTFYADFFNNTVGLYPFVGAAISSGVSGLSSLERVQTLGFVALSDSTTANGGYRITVNNSDLLRIRGGESYQATLRIASTSNKTIRFGFFDTTTNADATDGVYFEFNWTTNTTQIYGKTANASARSTTTTAYTFTIDTDYNFQIKINSSATLATFFIKDFNDNILWSDTLSTNMPTSPTGVGIIATESTTSAAAAMLFIDYMEFTIPRKLLR